MAEQPQDFLTYTSLQTDMYTPYKSPAKSKISMNE